VDAVNGTTDVYLNDVHLTSVQEVRYTGTAYDLVPEVTLVLAPNYLEFEAEAAVHVIKQTVHRVLLNEEPEERD
jgi:hypothetical protein